LMFCNAVSAQVSTTGKIAGIATDTSGQPWPPPR
jgi:hypothetical protein